jgi:hypothetical protein
VVKKNTIFRDITQRSPLKATCFHSGTLLGLFYPEYGVDFQRTTRCYMSEDKYSSTCRFVSVNVFSFYGSSKQFNIPDITAQSCTIAEVVTLFNMQFVDAFIICIFTRFHTPSYNVSLVITTKLIVINTFRISAILFYTVHKITLISDVRFHNFKTPY